MQQQSKDFIKETLYIVILSLVIVLPIRAFIAQPYIVSGASMDNTFQNGNYLIVDEISYRFQEPKRGEVIVLKVPSKGLEMQNLPQNKTVYYIKRIIGLPGETVVLDGPRVAIINPQHPDGMTLKETYLDPNNIGGATNMRITLKKDEYFVLGDNRKVSADSRMWGTLPRNDIVGRVLFRLYPFNTLSILPAEARYDESSKL